MPRAEAEVLSSTGGTHPDTTDRKCLSCGAVDKFASDSSDEWSEFASDLIFKAFAAHLRKAGYEIEVYSQECDHGDHCHCPGSNRLRIPNFERCLCACHGALEPNRLEHRMRTDDDTVDY
jgi:hypothetical protein